MRCSRIRFRPSHPIALAAVLLALAQACSKNSGTGAAPADGAVAAADVGLVGDAAASNCAQIRACVYACATDMACAGRCVSSAPAAAQSAYQAVVSCSVQQCPQQDPDCRCNVECLFPDGVCTTQVDACVQDVEDPFCEIACH